MEKRRFSALEWLCIVLLLGMVILTFGQVVFRYLFNNAFSWIEEIVLLLFVVGTFTGATIAVKRNIHISIDSLFEILPLRLKKLLKLANSILIAIFMIVIISTSFPILKASYYTPSASLRFPVAAFYVPVTISCGFVIYFTLKELFFRK